MKFKMISGLALFMLLANAVSANPRSQSVQTPVKSVTIERVEFVDSPQTAQGFKKVIITVANNSDKEVANFTVMLLTGPDGRSGSGVSGPDRKSGKFGPHSTIVIERALRDVAGVKPAMRAVVFADGSFEGDENTSRAYLIRKEELTSALGRYETRISDLDRSATPKQDVAKIREDLLSDLREFAELDSLPPSRMPERFERLRLNIKRGVLSEILREVNNIIDAYKRQDTTPQDLGKHAVDNLKARI